MKTFKNSAVFLFLTIFMFTFYGCSNLFLDDYELGTISINLNRAGRAALYDNETISKLNLSVKVSGGPGADQERIDVKDGQVVIFNLTPGLWDITVLARLNNEIIAVGQKQVNVNSGPNGSVSIQMAEPNEYSDGTAEKPFFVFNDATLRKVGREESGWTLYAHYRQVENITLSAVENWDPIGRDDNDNDNKGFSGSYDGGGYKISNLKINKSDSWADGLFSVTADKSLIQNIVLDNVTIITGGGGLGAVTGINKGTVKNCSVTGTVRGKGWALGGIAGDNNGEITNCVFNGSVTNDAGGGGDTGGISGNNSGAIKECKFSGTVTDNSRDWNHTGGISGNNDAGGEIINCTAEGLIKKIAGVEMGGHAGGIAGYNKSVVRNSHFSGEVNSDAEYGSAGGVVGNNLNILTGSSAKGTVIGEGNAGGVAGNNYVNELTIVDDNWNVIGSEGIISAGIITNCFSESDVSGRSNVGGVAGSNINIIENSYSTGKVSSLFNAGGVAGSNKKYQYDGKDDNGPMYTGVIKNCYSTGSVTGKIELQNDGGELVSSYIGGIVGENEGDVLNNYSSGNISGGFGVGGIAGFNSSGMIQNCYATGDVSGLLQMIGGIAGQNNGNIINCYSTGNIRGDYNVGGIAGSNNGNIRFNAALNPYIFSDNISGIIDNISGRIAVSVELGDLGTSPPAGMLSMNFARSDMQGGPWNDINDNGRDGQDIAASEINSNWWQSVLNFPSDWNFPSSGLPTLKNMPAGTQNPVIK